MDELSSDMQYILQAFTGLEDRLTLLENAQGMGQNITYKMLTILVVYIIWTLYYSIESFYNSLY